MKNIALVGLLLMTTPLFSQRNYIPGYVISSKGDTVRGSIDYQSWNFNPNKIHFKTNSQDELTYTPSDILGFEVNDEIYKPAQVKVEIGLGAQQEYKKESTFLRALAIGSKSLYVYRDKDDGKERFYIKEDTTYELLMYKSYYKTREDGHEVLVENKVFTGQLTVYLLDCPSTKKMMGSLKYQKNSLVNLFRNYYECTNSGVAKSNSVIVFSKESKENEYGFLLGASMTSVKFTGDITPAGFLALIGPNYSSSIQPSIGFFYNSVFRGNRNKTSINFELLYTSFNVSGNYKSPPSYIGPSLSSHSQTGAAEIKLNALFKVKQPIGKSFLILNIGPTFGHTVSQTNSLSATYGEPMDGSKKYEFGLLGGVGYQKGKTSFIFRAERSTGLSPFISLKEEITRYYFLMGYNISSPHKNQKK